MNLKGLISIGSLVLCFALSVRAGWADGAYPNEMDWHVEVTLTDGTVLNGYVDWWEKDLNGFLGYYKAIKFATRNFELYKKSYPINDGGKIYGHAFCGEDLVKLPPETVKQIREMGDPVGSSMNISVTKEEIQMMQNFLVCSETFEDGPEDVLLFRYNPAITAKELHRYVLEWPRFAGNPKTSGEFFKKLKKKKIVLLVRDLPG